MDQILQDLMNASPLVTEHIAGLRSSINSEDDGGITLPQLIAESIEILIEQLKSQGILFYADQTDLVTDFYNAKFIISLYQSFTPNILAIRLKHDAKLYKNIYANIDGISSSEILVHILDAFQHYEPSEHNRDMYVYLHDKVNNNEAYAEAIMKLMTDISRREQIDSMPNFSEHVMAFFMKLVDERQKYRKLINKLTVIGIKVNSAISLRLSDRFRTEFSTLQVENIFAEYSTYKKSNPQVVDEAYAKLKKSSIFYIENYSDDELSDLSIDLVIAFIVTQFSDQTLFGITPDFTKLIQVYPDAQSLIGKVKTSLSL